MNRRNFLFITISTALLSNNLYEAKGQENNIKNSLNNHPSFNDIKKYNSERRVELKKNLKSEILKDFKEDRTIWLGKKIFTFAELN